MQKKCEGLSNLNCGRLCLRTGTIKDDDGEDVEGEERVRPEEQVAQVRPCDAVREAWCCLNIWFRSVYEELSKTDLTQNVYDIKGLLHLSQD